jgi:hypothetical protein
MGGGNLVTASAYDTMLHRDSRFWDVIAARKKLHDEKQQLLQQNTQGASDAAAFDPMVGPIVGRRRAFDGTTVTSPEVAAKADAAKGALETFSIGGEFDFLPEVVQGESQGDNQRPTTSATSGSGGPPKKDHLMEALMGALEDEDVQVTPDHEVVIFDSHPESVAFMPTAPILPNPNLDVSSHVPLPPKQDILPAIPSSASKPVPSLVTSPSSGEQKSETASETTEAVAPPIIDDVDALNAALLEVDDDLAAAGVAADDVDDVDFLNLDIDDAEIEDLENFLSKT